MEIIAVVCPQCGGRVETKGSDTRCVYCGTKIVVKQEKSIEICNFVHNRTNSNSEEQANLNRDGWDFIELGSYEKAEVKFEKAVDIFPRDINGWTGLVASSLLKEDFEKFGSSLESAFRLADYEQKNGIIDTILYVHQLNAGDLKDVIIHLLNYLPYNGKLWLNLYLSSIRLASEGETNNRSIGAAALPIFRQVCAEFNKIISSEDTTDYEKTLAQENLELCQKDYSNNYEVAAAHVEAQMYHLKSNKVLILISTLLGIAGIAFIILIIANLSGLK